MRTAVFLFCLWTAAQGSAHAQMEAEPSWAGAPVPIRHQAPELLTFDELKALSDNPYQRGAIRDKHQDLVTTPMVSNEAYYEGVRPHRPSSEAFGDFMRVVTWNVEQSLNVDGAIDAFTSEEAFSRRMNRRHRPGTSRHDRTLEERAFLEDADVVILQEMEVGMKRSGYRDAARDIARALNMNYAYLPTYLEVDPVLLGDEKVYFEAGEEDAEATVYYVADPNRYKGLFGVAVLSRYPIVHVEGFPLFEQPYDWYLQEKRKTAFLEKARRFGARHVFRESPHREIKVGGRAYFRVDLAVPDLPEGRVSVVNVHLEIKCTPAERAVQMAEMMNYIESIPHPVILAGDFNSAPYDLSPTSSPRLIQRSLTAPEFWFSRALEFMTPYALAAGVLRTVSNATKNYQNPTAVHVPLVAPNPAGETFRILERFRFADGGVFDFRGDVARSANGAGELSNSNERDVWAYAATFKVKRTLAHVVGKFRLDWVFVKAYLRAGDEGRGSYRFAPHFGRTLNRLNPALEEPISDHDPNIVDLPLHEPVI